MSVVNSAHICTTLFRCRVSADGPLFGPASELGNDASRQILKGLTIPQRLMYNPFLMANKNYLRGVAIERKVKDYLEILGYTVIRSAGSHGVFDIIAIKEGTDEPVRCIQCKRAATLIGAKRLIAKYKLPPTPPGSRPYVAELWVWVDRKGWYHDITGDKSLTNEI